MNPEITGSLLVVVFLALLALAIAWCLVPLILIGTNRRLSRLIAQQITTNVTLENLLTEQRKRAGPTP